LKGYWKLNGTAGSTIAHNEAVAATVGPNGTAVNAGVLTNFTYSAGKLSQGATLGGADNDYVDLGTSNTLKIGFPITVSAWVNWNGGGAGVAYSSDGMNGFFSGVTLAGSASVSIQFGDNTSTNVTTGRKILASSGITMPSGVWYHVVGVATDANTMKLYVNGVEVPGTVTGSAAAIAYGTTKSATIGYRDHGNAARLGGSIDEVAVWGATLSAAEIQTIYARQSAKYSGAFASRVMNALQTGMSWTTLSWIPTLPFFKNLPDAACTPVAPATTCAHANNETSTDYASLVGSTGATGANDLMSSLKGLWHLDETAATAGGGNDFKDDSGNSNPGEIEGGVTFGSAGRIGNAAKLNGTTGRIDLATLPISSGTTFTLSAWINLGALQATKRFFSTMDATNGVATKGVGLGVDNGSLAASGVNSNSFYLMTGRTSWAWSLWSSPANSVSAVGTWYHVAAVVTNASTNPPTVQLYVNGSAVVTTLWNNGASAVNYSTDDGAAKIGGAYSPGYQPYLNDFFNGSVDEVAVWNRALHANEIRQIFRRGANRIKHQVRVCTAADCSDDATGANWKGPDGTNLSYFSELNNSSVPLDGSGDVSKGLPSMLFSAFTSPVGTAMYFQYRTIFESDDTSTGCNYGSGATWCSPELKSVTVDPVHYDSGSPTVIGKTGMSYYSLASLTETITASACPNGVGYNLGKGALFSSATWYWWDSSKATGCAGAGTGAWCPADGTVAKSNDAATISSNASTFGTQVGTGTVYFKAFLKSSGTSKCELDKLDLAGQQ
jgi:hypothetical protein